MDRWRPHRAAEDQILRELADVFRTEDPEALEASDRLREAVESHAIPDEEIRPSGSLTVGGGVAEYPRDGTRFEEMIQRTDGALYAARHEGRT